VRDSLLWRLLGAQLVVIAIAVGISGALLTDLASHAFMMIMARYHIEPAMVEAEFLASTHRVLLEASLAAGAAAMFLGWAVVRRLMRPLGQMVEMAERIAQGNYARRVDPRGPDEIVRLAESLNRMADSLQRIEALRRDLVANVAHELRTPLTTLQGYLEALRDGVAPASPEMVASLHEEVLRLARLVDALHQLSQFDARRSRLQLAPLDFARLSHSLLDVYGPEFTRRGMSVHEVHDPHLPLIQADTDLVSQALRNLLDNALRYAPAGAAVTVSAAPHREAVRVAVANTGGEIPAEDLPRIFERFFRGEKSRSRETGGAGIGLALVQEIARAHDGEAGASSANGVTTIWFTLSFRPRTAPGVSPTLRGPQQIVGRAG